MPDLESLLVNVRHKQTGQQYHATLAELLEAAQTGDITLTDRNGDDVIARLEDPERQPTQLDAAPQIQSLEDRIVALETAPPPIIDARQSQDVAKLQAKMDLMELEKRAMAAIIRGRGDGGDYRWHGGDDDFTWNGVKTDAETFISRDDC